MNSIPKEGRHESLKEICNIPNTLTAIRAGVVGYVTYQLFQNGPSPETTYWYAGGMITDALDGYAARKLNQQTRFGKRFDPIVDSASFHLPLWGLAYSSDNPISQWVFLTSSWLLALRDIHLFKMWLELEHHGEMFDVSTIGKVKTWVQMSALTLLIGASPALYPQAVEIGTWLLWGGAAFSLATWVDYYKQVKERIQKIGEREDRNLE